MAVKEAVYFNYYNIEGRDTPETPKTPVWKERYAVVKDSIRSNNYSQESYYYQVFSNLEDIYYAKAVANRVKYKDENEVKSALKLKYLMNPTYDKYSDEQKYAMYFNELTMTLYGCISDGGNDKDPQLEGKISVYMESDKQSYNRKMVSMQVTNLLHNAGIDTKLFCNSRLVFTIDAFHFLVKVTGADDSLASQIEKALNTGNNGKELFFHILNSNSANISEDMKTKFRAMKEFQQVADLDLREFQQTKDGFVDSGGNYARGIYKKALKASDDAYIGNEAAIYNYFDHLITDLLCMNFQGIPDLDLSIVYQNEYLYDINSN